MGTLIEDAAEIADIADEIDTAITTKGGTLVGGGKLRNAVEGIESIPSGGAVEYPVPWASDDWTHIWVRVDSLKKVNFSAQYISSGHTFNVDWGDETSQTIAASGSYTTRLLEHTYEESGDYEIVISGYDSIKIANSDTFGYQYNSTVCRRTLIRQFQTGSLTHSEITGTFGTAYIVALKFGGNITKLTSSFSGTLIKEVQQTNATSIGAFSNCAILDKFNSQPFLTSLPNNALSGCENLVEVGDLPSLTTFGTTVFGGCSKLKKIGDLSSLTTFNVSYPPFYLTSIKVLEEVKFSSKTHTEVESIANFSSLFPITGTQKPVYHCSDGDFYRDGSSLLPVTV